MNLHQLEETLPNGFHDARLLGMTARFDRSELEMELEVWIGDPDADATATRDAYRRAVLKLSGLEGMSVEPPERVEAGGFSRPLNLDAGSGAPLGHRDPFPTIPPGYFNHWFFVSAWNSFIFVVARDAQLQWSTSSSG